MSASLSPVIGVIELLTFTGLQLSHTTKHCHGLVSTLSVPQANSELLYDLRSVMCDMTRSPKPNLYPFEALLSPAYRAVFFQVFLLRKVQCTSLQQSWIEYPGSTPFISITEACPGF